MSTKSIPLNKLHNHPANANVMDDQTLAKLKHHIEQAGYYEPLVVRPHPSRPGCYEILNGHHRQKALHQLGYQSANCIVWDVTDQQALMFLATLNRLSGQDDLRKRAALLEKLSQKYEQSNLLASLPEKREQLQKLLALNRPPRMTAPQDLPEMPLAMTFFVTSGQKQIIEQGLSSIRREVQKNAPGVKPKRSELLTALVEKMMRLSHELPKPSCPNKGEMKHA